ncbi:MAG: gene transfer agent family protein [Bosea sp. (in: a-proteobacteria)]
MVNRHRGEIPLVIAGQRLSLKLTLGGLAEMEDALGVGDLVGLGERLGSGRLSANDIVGILRIGLKGAGHDVTEAQIRGWSVEAGLGPLVSAIVALFLETFGAADEASPARPTKP